MRIYAYLGCKCQLPMLREIGIHPIESPFNSLGTYNLNKLCELLLSDGTDWFTDVVVRRCQISKWSVWCKKYQMRSLHTIDEKESIHRVPSLISETMQSNLREFRTQIQECEHVTYIRFNEENTPVEDSYRLHDTLQKITPCPFRLCLTQHSNRQNYLPLTFELKASYMALPNWDEENKKWERDSYDDSQKRAARLIVPHNLM